MYVLPPRLFTSLQHVSVIYCSVIKMIKITVQPELRITGKGHDGKTRPRTGRTGP